MLLAAQDGFGLDPNAFSHTGPPIATRFPSVVYGPCKSKVETQPIKAA